jgi:hypothetical protein
MLVSFLFFSSVTPQAILNRIIRQPEAPKLEPGTAQMRNPSATFHGSSNQGTKVHHRHGFDCE